MSQNSSTDSIGVAWYCLQTQPKREHIAAAMLRRHSPDVEVYCPRLRFRKVTQTGPKWFTEALFPCYIFVRCDLELHKRLVQGAHGVTRFLVFGGRIPTIPAIFVEELRAQSGDEEILVSKEEFQVGDEVVVVSGDFAGLQTAITRLTNGKQRAHVLLDFLGRTCEAELDLAQLQSANQPRETVFRKE